MPNELIERLAASPVMYREQRVITLRMMDELHGRPEGTAGRNFREHKDKLVPEEDYFEVPQAELPQALLETTNFVGSSPTHGGARRALICLTESGYLLLVKTFTDDIAWKVQRVLVTVYFRAKQGNSGDVLLDGLKSLVLLRESQIVLERRTAAASELAGEAKQWAVAAMAKAESNHGYFSVLGFAKRRKMEMPVSEASAHGKKLTAICKGRGIRVQKLTDPRFGVVNTYPESILEEYFGDGRKN